MQNLHFFDRLRSHINSIMHSSGGYDFTERIFYAFSICYGALSALRACFYRKNILKSLRLPCFVISVGNISTGGTGKTPMTLYLAKMLRGWGYRSVILSRGYKGRYMKKGGIVSDGKSVWMKPDDSGDEPYMMALNLKDVPVLVGRNRCKSAMLAIREFKPDIILLDDGFQHLKLKRDLDLVLLDCEKPLGNGHLLPRGMLREPVSALRRANGIILTRCETQNLQMDKILQKNSLTVPVFRTSHIPFISCVTDKHGQPIPLHQANQKRDFSLFKGQRVFVFSGIARNDLFLHTVESFGCIAAGSAGFPDHHPYSAADMQEIERQAREKNVRLIVTTEKDFVRIPKSGLSGDTEFSAGLAVMGIEISFGDDSEFFASFVRESLKNSGILP